MQQVATCWSSGVLAAAGRVRSPLVESSGDRPGAAGRCSGSPLLSQWRSRSAAEPGTAGRHASSAGMWAILRSRTRPVNLADMEFLADSAPSLCTAAGTAAAATATPIWRSGDNSATTCIASSGRETFERLTALVLPLRRCAGGCLCRGWAPPPQTIRAAGGLRVCDWVDGDDPAGQ